MPSSAFNVALKLNPFECTRQCRHNLLAVSRPFLPQDFASNPITHLPVKQRQPGINRLRDALAGRQD